MRDTIEFYRSGLRRRKWRWRYIAANGNILADSGQGYSRRQDAVTGASRVIGQAIVVNPGSDADAATGLFAFDVVR